MEAATLNILFFWCSPVFLPPFDCFLYHCIAFLDPVVCKLSVCGDILVMWDLFEVYEARKIYFSPDKRSHVWDRPNMKDLLRSFMWCRSVLEGSDANGMWLRRLQLLQRVQAVESSSCYSHNFFCNVNMWDTYLAILPQPGCSPP